MSQFVRQAEADPQMRLEPRLLDFQVRVNVVDFIGQRHHVRRTLEVFAKECREILHQLTRLVAVAADHRHQRVQGVKQKMRIDLGVQQLDFRLGEQLFLAFILARQDLRRQQLRDPLPQRAVNGAEQPVFRLIEFDGADHFAVFAAQRDHQRRAEFAVRVERAAVRHLVAVGVNHFAGRNRPQRPGRRDRAARQMVIHTDAGKRQQLLAVGNGDRAYLQLLADHLRHLHAVLDVKTLAQNPFRRGGDLQRSGGKRGGVFLKHGAFIEQNTHKHRGPDGIGDHHRRGDVLHQMQRVAERARDKQNDAHLDNLRHQRDSPCGKRVKDFIGAPAANQPAMNDAAEQPFDNRRHHAA
ncbi:hypothetical protein BN133_1539 [Cronobacter dublinensis 582]|nr:hypothetical protein BN133_1539 [Cronobacter dublinensis 582]